MPFSTPSRGAETIALKALGFLAESPAELERFLLLSGLRPEELRSGADSPEILAAVLDFLLASEPLLIAFCESEATDARAIFHAKHTLAGG